MEKSRVSVITLCYKNWDHYKECIDSILMQTYDDIEIIIGDDASPDFSIDEFYDYINDNQSNNIKKVTIYQNETNLGVIGNYEKALTYAYGEVVFYLAIDDLFYNNEVLKDVMTFFHENDYAVIGGYSEKFFSDGTTQKLPNINGARLLNEGSADEIYIKHIRIPLLIGACTPFRRNLVEQYGFVDKKYQHLEDWPRYLYWMEQGVKFGFLNKTLVRYRSGGISTKPSNPEFIHDFGLLFDKYSKPPYSDIWDALKHKKIIAAWGASGGFLSFYPLWNQLTDRSVDFIVDKNEKLHGTKVLGIDVYPIDELNCYDKNNIYILVFSESYYIEIAEELEHMGFSEGKHFDLICEPRVKGLESIIKIKIDYE